MNKYEKYETKIIPCLLSQEWLDQNYPKNGTCIRKNEGYGFNNFGKKREEIIKLYIGDIGLEGNLDLSDFKNLEALSCKNNCLTSLNVNGCRELKIIDCYINQLTTLNLNDLEELRELNCSDNFLTQIIYPSNPEKITYLHVRNNNLSLQDLSIFSKFGDLRALSIGNEDENKINQRIHNHFEGSLEPLRDLNNLQELHIFNTDINGGWEYLSDSLERFWYDTELRPDCKLAQATAELEKEI